MKLFIEIDTDGSAWTPEDNGYAELEEVLSKVPRPVDVQAPANGFLRDTNGNRTGTWRYEP